MHSFRLVQTSSYSQIRHFQVQLNYMGRHLNLNVPCYYLHLASLNNLLIIWMGKVLQHNIEIDSSEWTIYENIDRDAYKHTSYYIYYIGLLILPCGFRWAAACLLECEPLLQNAMWLLLLIKVEHTHLQNIAIYSIISSYLKEVKNVVIHP